MNRSGPMVVDIKMIIQSKMIMIERWIDHETQQLKRIVCLENAISRWTNVNWNGENCSSLSRIVREFDRVKCDGSLHEIAILNSLSLQVCRIVELQKQIDSKMMDVRKKKRCIDRLPNNRFKPDGVEVKTKRFFKRCSPNKKDKYWGMTLHITEMAEAFLEKFDATQTETDQDFRSNNLRQNKSSHQGSESETNTKKESSTLKIAPTKQKLSLKIRISPEMRNR
ncbi:hypothetical protein ScPMuIL_014098 [Solemya velum]